MANDDFKTYDNAGRVYCPTMDDYFRAVKRIRELEAEKKEAFEKGKKAGREESDNQFNAKYNCHKHGQVLVREITKEARELMEGILCPFCVVGVYQKTLERLDQKTRQYCDDYPHVVELRKLLNCQKDKIAKLEAEIDVQKHELELEHGACKTFLKENKKLREALLGLMNDIGCNFDGRYSDCSCHTCESNRKAKKALEGDGE